MDQVESITPEELADKVANGAEVNILDVRKNTEHFSEHLINSENMALDYINEAIAQVDKNKSYYVHCADGYRSMIFNSILRASSFDNLIDIKGGLKALKESGKFKLSPYVCPSTINLKSFVNISI